MTLLLTERSLSTLDTVHCMDALSLLRGLPDNFVNCIVTSPPYFGLRDYGVAGQMGLEETPQAYVAALVRLFREARRVLREDGTCWINLGDSYAGSNNGSNDYRETNNLGTMIDGRDNLHKPNSKGVQPKNLLLIPARVAIALQDDGWIVRSDIIWSKPNPMPESVTDRPTKSHEYVFLLTKSPRYWYDADAIREPHSDATLPRMLRGVSDSHKNIHGAPGQTPHSMNKPRKHAGTNHGSNGTGFQGHSGYFKADGTPLVNPLGRNRRTVWEMNTEPNSFAHFATFPQKLIEPMILAGCPEKVCAVCGAPYVRETERVSVREQAEEVRPVKTIPSFVALNKNSKTSGLSVAGNASKHPIITDKGFHAACNCNAETRAGIVYDPFMGSGTTGLVARRLGRHYIGSELNPEYVAIARDRLRLPFEPRHVKHKNDVSDLPMFAEVKA